MAHKTGSSSGFAVGVGMTGGGDAGVGSGFSRQLTDIAKLAKPPTKEGGAGESLAFMFIAIVIFNFVGVALSLLFIWITGRESGDVSAWLTGMFIGFIAAVGYGIWAWKRTEGRKSNIEAAYKAAMKKWEHSWICLRCGNTYRVR